MSFIDNLIDSWQGDNRNDLSHEHQEFLERRQYERDVFESALQEWIVMSGLGSVMLRQMEDYARRCGLDEGWPDHIRDYEGIDFDPRNPEHREIAEHIGQGYDAHDVPATVYLVSELDADHHCGSHPIEAFKSRKRAEERAEGQYDLIVDEIEVGDSGLGNAPG